LGQTAARPGAVQPTAARPGAIQPAPRQAARPSSGYDPFLDEGEPSDFGEQRSWLRWGMAIGAVVVIGVILGVYFGFIAGGTEPTTTLAPTTTVIETTTTDTEAPQLQAIWTDLAPLGDLPAARSAHATAYDATNNLVVLFGGWDKANVTFNDTWVFDSSANTWTKITPPGKLPAARAQHQMVLDSGTGTVIMFGGTSKASGTQLKDTWAYDPTAKTWTDKNPSGTVPSARSSFSMVFDDQNQVIILFGGYSKTTGADLNDTWAYDPATNTWTELTTTGDVPTARGGSAMSYDQFESKIVLFGGTDSKAKTYFNDTYVFEYSTKTWTKVTPAGDTPSIRAGHRMVYDPTLSNTVLFGGWDGTAYFNDTWTFTIATSTWTNMNISNAPSARDSHSLLYSAITNELILFGGYVGTDAAQDTWSFGMTEGTTTEDTLPVTEETETISGTTTTLAP
jgi:N-acetylneuraminic acid mutarotase